MRNSFVFYSSFYEAIEDLPDDVQLQLYKAIASYSLTGELPELTGLSKTIFTLMKPQIEANNKKYEDGKKGGRPKKKTSGFENKKTSGFENKKPVGGAEKKPNVNVNENVNENDNENVNENDNENVNVNKPSKKQILDYANNQLCKRINADEFVNWYDAQGWIDKNGFPINWKQKVQSWIRNNSKNTPTKEKKTEQKQEEIDYSDYSNYPFI